MRMQRNGVTLEPLNFPATQSILWNRTAQGETETLHLTSKRNVRLYVNEKTLRLARRHVNQSKSSFECFFVGSISVDSREDSIDVTVDRFDPGREVLVNNGTAKVKRKVPTTVVPGDHIVPVTLIRGLSGAENSVTYTEEEFQKAFQVLFGRISSQETMNLSHIVSLKVCCHSHGDDDEIIINVNCGTITMGTQFQATPVAAVPIIPTALARNLSGPLRLSEVQGAPKCGYLTMDHTRKLLLLLESDPKAFSLPLLGIWVSGIYNIHHPFIWACCLRFLHSTAIQQRVRAPPNSFLLLLYSPVKNTPEFWECRQDQENSEGKMFEFYSCYENLHLETPLGPSSSEPLCFELLPAPEGMGRSLFEKAAEVWEKEHKVPRLNQDGVNTNEDQLMTSSTQGPGEEEPSPVPRPSPSPHPQNLQFVLPEVKETSLSLSFEEQVSAEHSEHGYANQQILPHPKRHMQQTKPQNQPGKQLQRDQENVNANKRQESSTGLVKVKEPLKQVRNKSAPQNSPSRDPLKQILAPNQTLAREDNQKQNHVHQKPHQEQRTAVQIPNRRGNSPGHNSQERLQRVFENHDAARSKGNVKQTSINRPNVIHGIDQGRDDQNVQKTSDPRPRPKPQGSECADKRTIHNLPRQQVTSSKHHIEENRERQGDKQHFVKLMDDNSFLLHENQVEKHSLETVYEGETPDGTLNRSMSETELGLQITETTPAANGPLVSHQPQRGLSNTDREFFGSANAGLNSDQDRQTKQGYIQEQRSSGIRGDISAFPADSEGHTTKERLDDTAGFTSNSNTQEQIPREGRQQLKSREENTHVQMHQEGTRQKDKQVGDSFPVQQTSAEATTLPDPYQLLMRQEAQLRELQEQIKLLLQQQNASPLPTPNTLLTPPRTPHSESSHGNSRSSDHSHVSMVTACTNTGASLLLGSPVKPRGKRSAATSPIKEKEINHSKGSLSTSSVLASEMSSLETSHKNSKQSQRSKITVNPDEFTNQVLEIDDPSQTLASSLHAVDIPSFVDSPSGVTSPSSNDKPERGGMETSFTSPVLGESASILMEQRQNECESQSTDKEDVGEDESNGKMSNHVSMLQRNERQFYDNLLDQVKTILDHQIQEHSAFEDPPQKSDPTEPATPHYATREEVVMATMKELEKLKANAMETEEETVKTPVSALFKQWPLHRSASLSFIPDHPRINYLSLSVDDSMDEVFSEADFKYLTDNQRQELQQINGHRKNHGRDRAVTFNDSVCQSAVDYTWNNLSMATKDYLGKYCLAPKQSGKSEDKNYEQLGVTTARKATDFSNGRRELHTSVEYQGGKAPPPTPEPANKGESTSQILDITRLKKLPKLI
ncbi:hypothetical protein ACROYT_G044274 [Oculina patagonica]